MVVVVEVVVIGQNPSLSSDSFVFEPNLQKPCGYPGLGIRLHPHGAVHQAPHVRLRQASVEVEVEVDVVVMLVDVVAVVVNSPAMHWHVGHSSLLQYPSDSNGRHFGPAQCVPTGQIQLAPPLIEVLSGGHSAGAATDPAAVVGAAVTGVAPVMPSALPPHTQHACFAETPNAPGMLPSSEHRAGASANHLQLKADPSPSCQGLPLGNVASAHASPSPRPSPPSSAPSRLLLPAGPTHIQSGHVTVSKYHSETSPRQPSPVQTAVPTQRQAVLPLYRYLLNGGQSNAVEVVDVVVVDVAVVDVVGGAGVVFAIVVAGARGVVVSGLSAQLDPRLFTFVVIPSRQHPCRDSAQGVGVVVVAVTVVAVMVVAVLVVAVVVVVAVVSVTVDVPTCTVGDGACSVVI